MITSQPFFISGIEDPVEARASAFGAFAMFLFTFAVSALGIWYDAQNKSDPMDSNGNGGETEYQLQGDQNQTNYGSSS
jgi:hypothetical protein